MVGIFADIKSKWWLYNIKTKDSEICEYCNEVDDIVHFFLKCSKSQRFLEFDTKLAGTFEWNTSQKHPNI